MSERVRNNPKAATAGSGFGKVTRRGFIGAGIAIPIAAIGLENDDEADLDFLWSDDRRQILISARSADDRRLPGEWRLDLQFFCPSAKFSLTASVRRSGAKTYRLRVREVSFGRSPSQPLTFIFSQDIERKNFSVVLESSVISSELDTLRFPKFSMSDMPKEADAAVGNVGVPFRRIRMATADISAISFGQVVDCSRISNTMRLFFNGQIDSSRPSAKAQLRFHCDGKWSARIPLRSNPLISFTAFGGAVRFREFYFFWNVPTDADPGAFGNRDGLWKGPRLEAYCDEAVLSGDAMERKTTRGPSIRLSFGRSIQSSTTEKFKMHWRAISGPTQESPVYRSEAGCVLENCWLSLDGDPTERMGALGPLRMRLSERVEVPFTTSRENFANRAGSLVYDGNFDKKATAISVDTPIGPVVIETDMSDSKRETTGAEHDLPSEIFAPRTARPIALAQVWNHTSGSTRDRPTTEFIEVQALLRHASPSVMGADTSRLDFAPSNIVILYSARPVADSIQGSFIMLGPSDGARAMLDLSRAVLRVGRAADLLSLRFRFQGLSLMLGARVELVSNSRTCQRVVPGYFSHDSEYYGVYSDPPASISASPQLPSEDPRPRLLVEFPPQHLLEETLAIPSLPDLPDIKLNIPKLNFDLLSGEVRENGSRSFQPDVPASVIEALSSLPSISARKKFRQDLLRKKADRGTDVPSQGPEIKNRLIFSKLADAYSKASGHLPGDQQVYIGPYALDPDAISLLRKLWRGLLNDPLKNEFVEMLNAIPELGKNLLSQLKLKASKDQALTLPEQQALNHTENIVNAVAFEQLLERSRPAYRQFRDWYREYRIEQFAEGVKGGPTSLDSDEIEFLHRNLSVPVDPTTPTIKHYLDEVTKTPEPRGLMRGRLSQPSRLVFRINCRDALTVARLGASALDPPEHLTGRDAEGGQGLARPGLARDVFPFSLAALTNFADMELAVVRRAELVPTPDRAGRIDQRYDGTVNREIDLNMSAQLEHLGFRSGDWLTSRERLADIARTLVPPGPFETAIDMSRLTLSPHQLAVFLTPKPVPSEVFVARLRTRPGRAAAGMTRIWSADLVTSGMDPGVRAVYSPDFVPEFLWRRDVQHAPIDYTHEGQAHSYTLPFGAPPPRGPFPSWRLGREGTSPRGLSDLARNYDEDELVRQSLDAVAADSATQADDAFCKAVLDAAQTPSTRLSLPYIFDVLCRRKARLPKAFELFRTSMDAFDRHEIVVLSSVWGLPVMGRRSETGVLQDEKTSSQVEADRRDQLVDLVPGSAIYVPRALSVSKLSLTALGATFVHNTGFEPPAGALQMNGEALFDAFSVESWRQRIVLGREMQCEIVYKGFLLPFGHRCSMVKLTERGFFLDRSQASGPSIRAYLNQRLFLRVGKEDKAFPAVGQPLQGRQFSARNIKILLRETPDLVDPNQDLPDPGVKVAPRGRLNLHGAPGLAFWPRTAPSELANIRFQCAVDGNKTILPLMFVDNTAANSPDALEIIVRYYNELPDTTDARTCSFDKAKLRYADERESGSASCETLAWTLSVSGRAPAGEQPQTLANDLFGMRMDRFEFSPALQGADQPPFYPVIHEASLRLVQTERLLGRELPPVKARFDGRYLADGLVPLGSDVNDGEKEKLAQQNNTAEIYLALFNAAEIDMNTAGDRSGGLLRPKGFPAALSRKRGVLLLSKEKPKTEDGHAGPAKGNAFGGIWQSRTESFNEVDPGPAPAPTVASGNSRQTSEPSSTSQDGAGANPKAIEVFNRSLGDTKLLGTVDLSRLIAYASTFLGNPSDKLPKLTEVLRFGAESIPLENLVQTLRPRLIVPMAETVSAVQRKWAEIDADLSERQQKAIGSGNDLGLITPIRVAEVFPDLDTGLRELNAALNVSADLDDPILFSLSLGQVYEAGRRFIDALIRTAQNPVERFDAAFTSRVQKVAQVIGNLGEGFLPLMLKQLGDLGIPTDLVSLRFGVTNMIMPPSQNPEETFKPFRPMILIASSDSLPEGAISALKNANDALSFSTAELRLAIYTVVDATIRPNSVDTTALLEHNVPEAPFDDPAGEFNNYLDYKGRPLRTMLSERMQQKLDRARVELSRYAGAELAQIIVWIDRQLLILKNEAEDAALTAADWLFDRFGPEIQRASEIAQIIRAIRESLDRKDVPSALRSGIKLVESFTGPVLSPVLSDIEKTCAEALPPLRQVLQAVDLGALTLRPADIPADLVKQNEQGEIVSPPQTAPAKPTVADHALRAHLDLIAIGKDRSFDQVRKALVDLKADLAPQPQLQPSVQALIDSIGQAQIRLSSLMRQTGRFYLLAANDAIQSAQQNEVLASLIPEDASVLCSDLTQLPAKVAQLSQTLESYLLGRRRLLDGLLTGKDAVLKLIAEDLKLLLSNRAVQMALSGNLLLDTFPDSQLEALKAQAQAAIQVLHGSLAATESFLIDTTETGLRALIGLVATVDDHMRELATTYRTTVEPIIRVSGLIATLDQLRPHRAFLEETATELAKIREEPGATPGKRLKELAELWTRQKPGIPALVNYLTDPSIAPGEMTLAALANAEAQAINIANQLRNLLSQFMQNLRTAGLAALDEPVLRLLRADINGATLPSFYSLALSDRNELYQRAQENGLTPVAERLLVPRDAVRTALVASPDNSAEQDQLWADQKLLEQITSEGAKPISDAGMRTFLKAFVSEWLDGNATPMRIGKAVGDLVLDLLRGDVLKLIDIDAIRAELEARLRALVPTELVMGYDFDMPLDPKMREASGGIFEPQNGSFLSIRSEVRVKLDPKDFKSTFVAKGEVGPFSIKLIGSILDALTLHFGGASFSSETGKPARMDAIYLDHEIGPALKFVEDLASLLSPRQGSGPFINPQAHGLEAGYGLQIADFQLGTVSFQNIMLRASMLIPFDDSSARFRASLSSRQSPFIVANTPYGGAGYFMIEADATGIVGFEAAFEFGGVAGFSYGPLTGVGRLNFGVFIRQYRSDDGRTLTDIGATFFLGGAAKIWSFSFGAAMMVRLGQTGGGGMEGEATFTYSFSVGLVDFDFSIRVRKSEGKGFTGQNTDSGRIRYAQAGASGLSANPAEAAGKYGLGFGESPNPPAKDEPVIALDVVTQTKNWPEYNDYFSEAAMSKELMP